MDNFKEQFCPCGSKEKYRYLDGGSISCEKGHIFHICRVDGIKKYGWIKCFGQQNKKNCPNSREPVFVVNKPF